MPRLLHYPCSSLNTHFRTGKIPKTCYRPVMDGERRNGQHGTQADRAIPYPNQVTSPPSHLSPKISFTHWTLPTLRFGIASPSAFKQHPLSSILFNPANLVNPVFLVHPASSRNAQKPQKPHPKSPRSSRRLYCIKSDIPHLQPLASAHFQHSQSPIIPSPLSAQNAQKPPEPQNPQNPRR